MANTLALGASAARLAGSSPAFRTKDIPDDFGANRETGQSPALGLRLALSRPRAHHPAEYSSMRTARPTARPPHPFFELRTHPLDMLPPCLIFLDGDRPADPLVARERRDVFPGRQRLRVRRERLAEIRR